MNKTAIAAKSFIFIVAPSRIAAKSLANLAY